METIIPKEYKYDIDTALKLLLQEGCTEVYLFGSLAENTFDSSSDIDFAVKGLKKEKYFHVYGELLRVLDHPFDLVGLDYNNDFSKELMKTGTLQRVS